MRLIDADAFDECLEQAEIEATKNRRYVFASAINTIRANLANVPTIESQIIRCKDCKYGVDYYHEWDCYCSNPKHGLTYFGGSWEFYCADAERKTDE